MNKIILRPKEDRIQGRPPVKQLVVRSDLHAKLVGFARMTGRSLYDVTDELLEQACRMAEAVRYEQP